MLSWLTASAVPCQQQGCVQFAQVGQLAGLGMVVRVYLCVWFCGRCSQPCEEVGVCAWMVRQARLQEDSVLGVKPVCDEVSACPPGGLSLAVAPSTGCSRFQAM